MKFSKQLQYNKVSEWQQWYMDYAGLKRLIPKDGSTHAATASTAASTAAALIPAAHDGADGGGRLRDSLRRTASASVLMIDDSDQQQHNSIPLASSSLADSAPAFKTYGAIAGSSAGATFLVRVDGEADKVDQFFSQMESQLVFVTHELELDAARVMPLSRSSMSGDRRAATRNKQDGLRRALRKRYKEHYLETMELINFAELNSLGFGKILKKFDKAVGTHLRELHMPSIQTRHFSDTSRLKDIHDTTEAEYARLYFQGDVSAAHQELVTGLNELIVWERNTVWRDMLQSERKVQSMHAKGGSSQSPVKPRTLLFAVFLSVYIFLQPGLMNVLVRKSSDYSLNEIAAAQRALALLSFVTILWATEALPLYVTSIAIVPLSVMLGLFLDDDSGEVLDSSVAAQTALSGMAASVIMLIVGGFTISAALSKLNIDRKFATAVLSRVSSPSQVLLVVMLLAVFLSTWVSNVAAPVLLNSVVLTVLRGLPTSSTPLIQAILLGIAMSCNIGGMTSPISSPQNAVAIGQLRGVQEIGFVEWMTIAIPVSLLMVMLCHMLLVVMFRPESYVLPVVPKSHDPWTSRQLLTIGVMVITIFLWCFKPASLAFGNEGIIACFPVIAFFGSGILGKEDFNSLPWNVIYLVGGGICLGQAIESSNLLGIVAAALHHAMRDASLWSVFAVFVGFTLIVSCLVSHTVSAIIIFPMVAEVGAGLGHPRLLVMGTALACSSAMALPVSGFPNVSCVSVENELGKPYINVGHIAKVGVPMTLIGGVVILSIGFGYMMLMGF